MMGICQKVTINHGEDCDAQRMKLRGGRLFARPAGATSYATFLEMI